MPEIFASRDQDGLPVYTLKKRRLEIKNPIPKAIAGFVVAGAIGLIVWQCQDGQTQGPSLDSTPTPAVTKVPELTTVPAEKPIPTHTKVPTATPRPTEKSTTTPTETPEPTPTLRPSPTPEPTPVPASTPEPTRIPVPTRAATSTPQPALQPIEVPTSTSEPAPTPPPAVTPSTPTESQYNEYTPGYDRKITKCFDNTSAPFSGSIDITTTKGDLRNFRFEITSTEDSNTIIQQRQVIPIPLGKSCFRIDTAIKSGASNDCYEGLVVNLKGKGRNPVESLSLLPNLCINALKAFVRKETYYYNSTTKVGGFHFDLNNPSVVFDEQTKIITIEPCDFLPATVQQIQRLKSDLVINPNDIVTIPAKSSFSFKATFKLSYNAKDPVAPYECTMKLDRIREK